MSSTAPYRIPRLIALTLVQWTGVVIGGLAGRSLVILEDRQKEIAESPLPNAILHGGQMVAASSVLITASGIAGFDSFFISLILLFKPQRPIPRPAIFILAFSIIFLLAANLYTTCTGSLTKPFITTVPQLPQAIIDGAVAAKGQKLTWFSVPQVLGHVIVGWFTWLFCIIAVALEFMAKRRQGSTAETGMQQRSADSANSLRSDEKGAVSETDHA